MTENEFLDFLSQKLSEIGTAMMVYYDCCEIRGSVCRGGDPNPCCTNTIFGKGECPFRVKNRCEFFNPNCILWICKSAIDKTDPKCIEGLKLLEQFGVLYGLVRKPLIGHPYSGADKQSLR